ncbi:unnamed protein product [Candidula unifasciata]|uniref:Uncharacterized protein n=1 Tax=Candidula unifasciata TaxID=100452 RepID=A0A8S3YC32_9EUPU|nr:unnamed protein product [Candidula unifasciata]
MKADYVAGTICFLGFLCVVFASSMTGCASSWFGPNCKYKCRCEDNNCDKDGMCTEKFTCVRGWFGPSCQYDDIAYQFGDVVELTDGNDKTCVPASVEKSTTLNLNVSFIFTWMRVVVSKPKFRSQIKAKFTSNSNATECRNRTYTTVDSITMDIHCEIADPIDEIVLSGDGVRYLCSVYVSGGRNLALKAKTEQSSTYSEQSPSTFQLNISFTSSKAVDGKTNQRLYDGFSCAMTQESPTRRQYWELTFSSPRSVHKYLIYGRTDSKDPEFRLSNISLESVDEAGNVVYDYSYTPTDSFQEVLTLIHSPQTVSRVNIHSNIFPRQLALCEVEIFGESICEAGKYGLDCENTCNCEDNTSCIISTGICPFASVIVSPTINKTCAPGTFGDDCSFKCSEFCTKNSVGVHSCKDPTGDCDEGCLNGYTESTCTERCPIGTYGKDCTQVCGPKCLEAKEPNTSSCHHASGVCLLGCQDEAFGPLCNSKVENSVRQSAGGNDTSYLNLIIGLFVGVLVLLPVLYCLRKKKPTRSHAEERNRRKP